MTPQEIAALVEKVRELDWRGVDGFVSCPGLDVDGWRQTANYNVRSRPNARDLADRHNQAVRLLLAAIVALQAERDAAEQRDREAETALAELRGRAQQWAVHAFNQHGDDSALYNGLADLGGVNADGVGWIPSDAGTAREGR